MSPFLLHRIEQPILKLQIRNAFCRFEVRVNDVPVFEEKRGLPIALECPLNEWLIAGTNVLEVTLQPLPQFLKPGEEDFESEAFDSATYLRSTLIAKRNGEKTREVTELGTLNFVMADTVHRDGIIGTPTGMESSSPAYQEKETAPSDDDSPPSDEPDIHALLAFSEPEKQEDPGTKRLIMRRTFTLPDDWPVWSWRHGSEIDISPGTIFILTRLYQQMWTALQTRRWAEVARLLETKIRDYAGAYYLDHYEATQHFGFERYLADERNQLLPFPEDLTRLDRMGNGRLVRLCAPDGRPPIEIVTPDGLSHGINLIYANLGNQWALVR